MWIWIVAFLAASVPPDVELRSARGETVVGTLVELDGRHVAVRSATGPVVWELEKLAHLVARGAAEPKGQAPIAVQLIDGTTMMARALTMDLGKARITLADGQATDVGGDDVRSIQFLPSSEATATQWSKMATAPTTADLLVVKKGDGIDYHKGLLRRITDETVDFELEGERLPVPRSKVFGLVYHHSSGRDLPERIGTFWDRDGSTWALRTMTLIGDQIEWTTVLGLKLRRPAAQLARLDFSHGRVAYLSDVQPDSSEWTPYFGGKPLPSLVAMNRPRQDKNVDAGPLRVGGQSYAKGMSMHAGTTLVYSLPERYRRFVATAGIDDAVRPLGKVRLTILGDDRVLFNDVVTGTGTPKVLDLDIAGVRRITLRADFCDDFDVGDHLDLCDARLLK